jgi:hypothetical protein
MFGAPLGGRKAWQRRALDRSKRTVRVKGYEPHDVGAHRGENESHLRDVEKSEKQKSVRQEAPADNELSMPANVQERVRPATGCLRLPDCQKLIRTPSGQAMPLKSCNEEARHSSEKKESTPYQIASRA